MRPHWIGYVAVALIGLSVLYELGTGVARVRGVGIYPRSERPRAYWLTVGLKAALATAVTLLTMFLPRWPRSPGLPLGGGGGLRAYIRTAPWDLGGPRAALGLPDTFPQSAAAGRLQGSLVPRWRSPRCRARRCTLPMPVRPQPRSTESRMPRRRTLPAASGPRSRPPRQPAKLANVGLGQRADRDAHPPTLLWGKHASKSWPRALACPAGLAPGRLGRFCQAKVHRDGGPRQLLPCAPRGDADALGTHGVREAGPRGVSARSTTARSRAK